jgi:2-dehydropantoate 2-reductase
MRALVVGAGSVGGYFGGRLAAAGRDVTFLVSPRRATQLTRGLTISSGGKDTVVPVKTTLAGESAGKFELIIVAVKAYQLDRAIEDFSPYVAEGTMILPVLNGMKHMDTLSMKFGAPQLIGGVAKVAASLDPQGRIVDQANFRDLAYGELSGKESPRMEALDSFMKGAGFDARQSREIEREMWEKWALLASLGAITCLMDGDIGEVTRAPGGVAFAEALFREVTNAIAAIWRPLSESFKTEGRALLTNRSSTLTSSMYRDMKAGHRIEADQIIGDLLIRAGGKDVATELLSATFTRLGVYERQQGYAADA